MLIRKGLKQSAHGVFYNANVCFHFVTTTLRLGLECIGRRKVAYSHDVCHEALYSAGGRKCLDLLDGGVAQEGWRVTDGVDLHNRL